MEGFGRLFETTGDFYIGEFAGGKKSGSGTMEFVNGMVFKGEFRKGEVTGQGVFQMPEGMEDQTETEEDFLNPGQEGGRPFVGEGPPENYELLDADYDKLPFDNLNKSLAR